MPIQITNEVSDLIGRGDCLSPSLRLSKYAKIGSKNEKRTAVDFFVNAKQEQIRPSFSVVNSISFIMRLGDKMIINQAGGVLENAGMCIHRHFGYPYIPGSALKGIARHAVWEEWFYEKHDDAQFAKQIADTFGYPTGEKTLDNFLKENGYDNEKGGSVSFLPAIPEGYAKLETDILTCHHTEYYAGKQNKALDNESPNPQCFPVVAEGTSFKFTIVPLRRSQNLIFNALELASKYLKLGIEEQGVGAKTSSGYGWFEEDPEIKKKEIANKEEEERLRVEKEKAAKEKAINDAQIKQWDIETKEKRLKEEKVKENENVLRVNDGFSGIKDETAIGTILAQAAKLKDAQNKEFEDSQKKELIEILKNSYKITGAKDKKWKSGKKSKATWSKIDTLLGNTLTDELKKELS